MSTESLTLKWGTLKEWDLKTEASMAALRKYQNAGNVSMSAMHQHDNAAQKAAILLLIDAVDCDTIYLDWDNKHVSKDEAKEYVLSYVKKNQGSPA